MNRRPESQQAADEALADELAQAEERGAARAIEAIRADLRDLLDERRRVVRLGEQQIEIVEISALDSLFGPDGHHRA